MFIGADGMIITLHEQPISALEQGVEGNGLSGWPYLPRNQAKRGKRLFQPSNAEHP